jgi:HK97 family phage portal protein
VTVALLFGRQRRGTEKRDASLDGYYGDLVGSYYGTFFGDHAGASGADLIPMRSAMPSTGLPAVTQESALRHSALWAALRLRANLLSTLPVDVFRKVDGMQVELPKPPVLVNPGGERVSMQEWLYSTQVDLDRCGNAFGLITERNGAGLPARIDLMPAVMVSVKINGGKLLYKFGTDVYTEDQVWHEKQYTLAGLPVGLSPVAYAAWTLAEHQSISDFALTWFGGGGVPRGHLRNKMQTLSPAAADAVKTKFKQTVTSGDVFVTGADWEYSMIQAEQTGMEWLEAKARSGLDIARFFDVPADMIDAAVAGQAITYANITQRNVQFLVMHLGPTINRREEALSRLLPQPRYVKFNTDALLRMDPASRADMYRVQIDSRVLTVDEARALENRPKLTDDQITQFAILFGDPNAMAIDRGFGGQPIGMNPEPPTPVAKPIAVDPNAPKEPAAPPKPAAPAPAG